ncbi:MAG: tRNA 2-thiouridine(34) synthase MnmA [Parcubacteria group bacterium]
MKNKKIKVALHHALRLGSGQAVEKIRVAVAMSGGVDSSVAAALLKQQGYDVFGVFMHFWNENVKGRARDNICCSLEAGEDARRVCRMLGIPFYTMNMSVPFKKKIVDDFVRQYGACRTPNPCVRCNQYIKFGEFLKKAKKMGADFIATGHYARVKREMQNAKSKIQNKFKNKNLKFKIKLLKSRDTNKDQTYFLLRLTQAQLKHVLFPIGGMTKPEVRKLAEKFGLAVHNKRESQEICFIPDGRLDLFLKRHLKIKPGLIKFAAPGCGGIDCINTDIRFRENPAPLIKENYHQGLPFYTFGQRKGIGLSGGPWYVARLDKKNNVLWVTKNENDLLLKELRVKNVNWISGAIPKSPLAVKCRIRYRSAEASATVVDSSKNQYLVKFKKPVRAATPGQYCVFWKGRECLGGGEIV